MKTIFIYFSATGNTEKIMLEYEKAFNSNNIAVDKLSIEKNEYRDLSVYDYIGIFYPVHAFNAPKNVIKYLKGIKKLQEKKSAFFVKSSGEPVKLNGISSYKARKILKRKNIIANVEYQYCMPYDIIFRHSDFFAYKMFESAKSVIPFDVKALLDNQGKKIPKVFMGKLIAFILRIEYFGAFLNGKFYKVNQNKCVKCMKCVNECPTKNIIYKDGKFRFGNKCLMCTRCAFYCKKDAIRLGLFNKWKVNGEYSFSEAEEIKDKHSNYCKKAYQRYFNELIERKTNR